jgi:uncharacterized protein
MPLTKDNLLQLIELQKKDAALDKVKVVLDQIPVMISKLKAQLETEKAKAAEVKNRVLTLEKKKKEKELELAQKEEAAKKHGAELNSVKTNEAFKALQTEIGFAKQAANEIETEILELMEQIDSARKEEKAKLAELANEQKAFEAEIAGHEKRLAEQQSGFDAQKAERDAAAAPIPADAMKVYEHVRKRGKLDAVVPIDGTICSACRIQLAPTVIVEATKAKALVACESCQRIIYRQETLAAKAA